MVIITCKDLSLLGYSLGFKSCTPYALAKAFLQLYLLSGKRYWYRIFISSFWLMILLGVIVSHLFGIDFRIISVLLLPFLLDSFINSEVAFNPTPVFTLFLVVFLVEGQFEHPTCRFNCFCFIIWSWNEVGLYELGNHFR